MKIEIGESIILSWLRHAKNCQIAQLNWKPSTGSWEYQNDDEIDKIIEDTQKYYLEEYGLNLFKKNASSSQIIQQGEVDVFGIEVKSTMIQKLYCVDIAFHERGLNYGKKEITVAKVLQKLVRSAVTIIGYFDMKEGEIIFASPKINKSIAPKLIKLVDELNYDFNKKWNCKFNFSVICNDEFHNKIFNIVLALSKDVADTSELFMRSIQLFNLFEKDNEHTKNSTKKQKNTLVNVDLVTDLSGVEEIKIGALVRNSLPDIINNRKLSDDQFYNLLDKDFCKKTFDVNYAVLKKVDGNKTIKENRYEGAHPRYYAFTTKAFGCEYLITSEWFDRNKPYYIKWLHDIKTDTVGD